MSLSCPFSQCIVFLKVYWYYSALQYRKIRLRNLDASKWWGSSKSRRWWLITSDLLRQSLQPGLGESFQSFKYLTCSRSPGLFPSGNSRRRWWESSSYFSERVVVPSLIKPSCLSRQVIPLSFTIDMIWYDICRVHNGWKLLTFFTEANFAEPTDLLFLLLIQRAATSHSTTSAVRMAPSMIYSWGWLYSTFSSS